MDAENVASLETSVSVIDYGPAPLRIAFKAFYLISHNAGVDLTGLRIWPGAELLARFLGSFPRDALAGVTCLEVGSGVGLPGLIATSLCSYVIISDRVAEVLQLADCNIVDNKIANACSYDLEWSAENVSALLNSLPTLLSPLQARSPPTASGISLVIGADIIYPYTPEEVIVALLHTIKALLSSCDGKSQEGEKGSVGKDCPGEQKREEDVRALRQGAFLLSYTPRCLQVGKLFLSHFLAELDCEVLNPHALYEEYIYLKPHLLLRFTMPPLTGARSSAPDEHESVESAWMLRPELFPMWRVVETPDEVQRRLNISLSKYSCTCSLETLGLPIINSSLPFISTGTNTSNIPLSKNFIKLFI